MPDRETSCSSWNRHKGRRLSRDPPRDGDLKTPPSQGQTGGNVKIRINFRVSAKAAGSFRPNKVLIIVTPHAAEMGLVGGGRKGPHIWHTGGKGSRASGGKAEEIPEFPALGLIMSIKQLTSLRRNKGHTKPEVTRQGHLCCKKGGHKLPS